MPESVRIAIAEVSQTSEARRLARKMARDIGFAEIRAEQVAIAVTEACTNILKHAGRGEILLRIANLDTGEAGFGMEFLALDQGPGMASFERCLADGYTTGSSPGHGLGAIARLSTASDFYSVPGKGTALVARWSTPPPTLPPALGVARLAIGSVSVPKAGQEVCGDSWGVAQSEDSSTLMVADGLGHGIEAKQASAEAIRVLRANPGLGPLSLVELSHKALRSSRGAAVAVARIDRFRGTLTFAGVGNIAGQIYAGAQRGQHLVSVNGTAGHQTQRIREFTCVWPDNGILVLHSDGLSTTTGLESQPSLALHDPSVIAGVLYRDFARAHDDATVIIAKAA
jgi:anti-sigma regulatory factor (Ser/Thr protein kinase)